MHGEAGAPAPEPIPEDRSNIMRGDAAEEDPSGTYGSLGTLVAGLVAVLTASGTIPEDWVEPTLYTVSVLAPAAVAFFTRRKAWAPATVRRHLRRSYEEWQQQRPGT